MVLCYFETLRPCSRAVHELGFGKRLMPASTWWHVLARSGICEPQVAREIQIHSMLHHEHIIALYGAFEDSKHVYLVQEYAVGATLLIAPERQWVVLAMVIAGCRQSPRSPLDAV